MLSASCIGTVSGCWIKTAQDLQATSLNFVINTTKNRSFLFFVGFVSLFSLRLF